MGERTDFWHRVENDLDLYKFYLDLLVKAMAFALTLTGAIVGYFLANQGESLIVYSLGLPIVINLGLCAGCLLSSGAARAFVSAHYRLTDNSDLRLAYDLSTLVKGIYFSAVVYFLVTVGVVVVGSLDPS